MLAYDFQTKQIQTEAFDGPLELLLYLIRREGVDIREVNIAPITDAFLAHLDHIDILGLNTAGDFLVMATTLCYLKSQDLIPIEESNASQDELDPQAIRERLAQRLIAYQRYKDASERLANRPWLGRDNFVPQLESSLKPRTKLETDVDAFGLLNIFRTLIEKQQDTPPLLHIDKANYSFQEMGEWLLEQCLLGKTQLKSLLQRLESKADRVLCFLSALELGRLQHLSVIQTEHLGEIFITPNYQEKIPQLDFLDGFYER